MSDVPARRVVIVTHSFVALRTEREAAGRTPMLGYAFAAFQYPPEETLSCPTRSSKTDAEWKAVLAPEQYRITRKKGTERALQRRVLGQRANRAAIAASCCGTLALRRRNQVRRRLRMAELLRARSRRRT